MKKVDASMLLPGSTSQHDYYSERGEMLISKGVMITAKHTEMLRRRNIFEVFIKLSIDEEELERILSVDFKTLGELDIEATPEKPQPPPPPPARKPMALTLPEFREIKSGRDGLAQLLESKVASDLDSNFLGRTPDRPTGPALKEAATQVAVKDRTVEQKTTVASAYDEALAEVTRILNLLSDGFKVNGPDVRNVVKRFIKIFVTDRNILLNISGRKHAGDSYLYHHSLNVCLLSINIAASCGYSEPQIIEIGMGAFLHDIGMLLIPRDVVTKKARLEQEEWYEVQKHPVLGLHLLERISNLPESVPFVAYQIHERENKTGYPKQRGANLIHRFAKIVQVADIYEAMSSPRTYRPALIPYKSMANVIKMTRQGLISGEYVEAFLRYASMFPVGSLVELNDHRIAKVVDANATSFAKPVVSILTDTQGKHLPTAQISQFDLSSDTNTYITRALPLDHLKGSDLMDGF